MKKKTKKTKTCWGQGQRQGVAMGGYGQLYINGEITSRNYYIFSKPVLP